MDFSLRALLAAALGAPPKLVCDSKIWRTGVEELRHRCGRRKESGAFLLGSAGPKVKRIESFVFYDDLDPSCFDRGIVEFDGSKFGLLWEECRKRGLTVVADVHVHPGHFSQSESDRHNPMIPEAGHIALVIPNYAIGAANPGKIGVYEYLGGRRWRDHTFRGARVFHVGWWPR